jgi:hypothetical protein
MIDQFTKMIRDDLFDKMTYRRDSLHLSSWFTPLPTSFLNSCPESTQFVQFALDTAKPPVADQWLWEK